MKKLSIMAVFHRLLTKVVTISVPAVIKTITVTGSVIICFISVVYLAVVIDNVRDWKKENVFRMEIKAVSDSLYRLIQVYFKIEALILVINSILCIIALLIIKNSYAVVLGILIGIVVSFLFSEPEQFFFRGHYLNLLIKM